MPSPIEAARLSTMRMGTPSWATSAPCSAACLVADNSADKVITRIPVAPSAANFLNASAKAPGAGAAVCGRTGDAEQRAQNSVGVSEARSTNSSSPKLKVSGTKVMPNSSTRDCGRSQAESVTMRIVMIASVVQGAFWRFVVCGVGVCE